MSEQLYRYCIKRRGRADIDNLLGMINKGLDRTCTPDCQKANWADVGTAKHIRATMIEMLESVTMIKRDDIEAALSFARKD